MRVILCAVVRLLLTEIQLHLQIFALQFLQVVEISGSADCI